MPKQIQDAYIVAAVRTPVGKAPRGVFKNTRPDDLLAHVLRAVIAKAPNLDPKTIDDVIIGCAMPEAEQGLNIARIALLLADLPEVVGGVTVNRFCSSGLQAVSMAADRIRTGDVDVMIAGGVESMSAVPMTGNKAAMNPDIFNDEHVGIAYGMGITAEKVAEQWKVSRQDQDEFAIASHQKAISAMQSGHFHEEIAPYTVISRDVDLRNHELRKKEKVIGNDEGPRADTSLPVLAKLRPAFRSDGSVTAGNSSQTSDGAGAVLLMSEAALKRFNIQPIAKFHGFAVAGVPPEIMGIGPKFAIPKVLKQTGFNQQDISWIELNEAFAAQALAVIRDLGLDPAKVNPQGGAIALGHPLGATGAIRTATLLHGLKRNKLKYGMVTMCIGTGMGAAGIFENLMV